MNNDPHPPVTELQIATAFGKKGITCLTVPTKTHLRWNTKNAGDASLAWRVLFQLETGEMEINVRNISIQPGFSSNFPKTVTSIVDNELKGNVEIMVGAVHFDYQTRELVLFY